jgi:FkbM family methyltransferase
LSTFRDLLAGSAEIEAADARVKALGSMPTVLYGAGVYADEMTEFLASRGVKVAGRFVDDAYVEAARSRNPDVMSFAAVESSFERYAVVVAFCGDPTALKHKVEGLGSPKLEKVEVIDCRFWKRFARLRTDLQTDFDRFRAVFDSFCDDVSRCTYASYINTKLTFDPFPLQSLYSPDHYFAADLPEFAPRTDDVFYDCGAFTGDTLADFVRRTGGKGCRKYVAFEPEPANAAKLNAYAAREGLTFVEHRPTGVWSEQTTLRFQQSLDSASGIDAGGTLEIPVDRIDRLTDPVTFLKMDIEGAELEALKGAVETIRKYKPKFAIALYHKPEDLTEIPEFLRTVCPAYRFDLRLHARNSEELVLYGRI